MTALDNQKTSLNQIQLNIITEMKPRIPENEIYLWLSKSEANVREQLEGKIYFKLDSGFQ